MSVVIIRGYPYTYICINLFLWTRWRSGTVHYITTTTAVWIEGVLEHHDVLPVTEVIDATAFQLGGSGGLMCVSREGGRGRDKGGEEVRGSEEGGRERERGKEGGGKR